MSTSPASAEPVSLDPGTPIDICPVYFWDWVGAVRKYWEPSRGTAPLSSRVDLFPIIYERYHPRPGSTPNPSAHITYLRKAGLLRRFGDGSFWIPETEATIRVSGQVVYTPGDLDALLAHDERFKPPSQGVEMDPAVEAADSIQDGEPQDARDVEEPGQEDPPEAEQEAKEKKPRVRIRNREKRFPIGKLVQALWAAAEPTDDPAWRVIAKSSARERTVVECGNALPYASLYKLGFVKSSENHNMCLVTDPNVAFREAQSAVRGEQAPERPVAPMQVDLAHLSVEALQAKLQELEAPFDTAALEAECAQREQQIGEARSRAATLKRDADALEAQATALTAECEELSKEVKRLALTKLEDESILSLHWLIHNKSHLDRALATLAKGRS